MTRRPVDDQVDSQPIGCPKCGLVHDPRKCGGHVAACRNCGHREGARVGRPCPVCGGEVALRPCGRFPLKGASKCTSHGAGAPQVRAAAARKVETETIDRQVCELLAEHQPGLVGLDPTERLLWALSLAVGMAKVFELLVGALPAGKLWGPDHLGDARPHAAEVGLRHWTSEVARFSKMAIDTGVQERQIRWLEEQADEAIATSRMTLEEAVLVLAAAGLADEVAMRALLLERELPALMRRVFERMGSQLAIEATEVTDG